MNYPGLITALPATTIAAVATTPQGLTSSAQVEVAHRPSQSANTVRGLWILPPTVIVGDPILGGIIYTYTFNLAISKEGGTDAELEVWADQIRAHFDGRPRPASITDMISASVGDIVLRAAESGTGVEMIAEVSFTGVNRPGST